jgi:hypothetical protein
LAGHDVVILPDNDAAGENQAKQKIEACSIVGLRWKVVHLPGLGPKGDVTDFLELEGKGQDAIARQAEKLRALADSIPWIEPLPEITQALLIEALAKEEVLHLDDAGAAEEPTQALVCSCLHRFYVGGYVGEKIRASTAWKHAVRDAGVDVAEPILDAIAEHCAEFARKNRFGMQRGKRKAELFPIAPETLIEFMPFEEAQRQAVVNAREFLDETLARDAEAFQGPFRQWWRYGVSVGKTYQACGVASKRAYDSSLDKKSKRSAIFTRTIKLAEKTEQDLRKWNVRPEHILVYRGKLQPGMCPANDEGEGIVEEVQKAGIKYPCKREIEIIDEAGEEITEEIHCPHWDSCPWQAQKKAMKKARFIIAAHEAAVTVEDAKRIVKHVGLVIWDETPSNVDKGSTIQLEQARRADIWPGDLPGEEAEQWQEGLVRLVEFLLDADGTATQEELESIGWGLETIKSASKALNKGAFSLGDFIIPGMPADEIRETLKGLRENGALQERVEATRSAGVLLGTLRFFWENGGLFQAFRANGKSQTGEDGHRYKARWLEFRRPKWQISDFPTQHFLLLDATIRPEWAELLFPGLERKDLFCKQPGRVVQEFQAEMSHTYLNGADGAARVVEIARNRLPEGSAVFQPMGGEKLNKDDLIGNGFEIGHHGELEGRDDWAKVPAVLSMGRQQPGVLDVELTAAAWANYRGRKIDFIPSEGEGGRRFDKRLRGYHTASGKPAGVLVPSHHDGLVDAYLRTVRDGSVIQSNRMRGMHATDESLWLIGSNIPLEGIMVDELETMDKFATGQRKPEEPMGKIFRQIGSLPFSAIGPELYAMNPAVFTNQLMAIKYVDGFNRYLLTYYGTGNEVPIRITWADGVIPKGLDEEMFRKAGWFISADRPAVGVARYRCGASTRWKYWFFNPGRFHKEETLREDIKNRLANSGLDEMKAFEVIGKVEQEMPSESYNLGDAWEVPTPTESLDLRDDRPGEELGEEQPPEEEMQAAPSPAEEKPMWEAESEGRSAEPAIEWHFLDEMAPESICA